MKKTQATRRGALVLVVTMATTSPGWAQPKPPPRPATQHFSVDPVADGTLITAGAGFALLSNLILSTGELVPQSPGSPANLLWIDRGAVTQTLDPRGGTLSNLGLWGAVAFAGIDPLVSGWRSGAGSGWVDAVLYSETLSITWAVTNLTKLAVRRPRPIAYIQQAELDRQGNPGDRLTTTDVNLSFFSGHTAIVAATVATASYLSFMRYPNRRGPWYFLAIGTAVTGLVGWGRVKSGAHFPTDVIAGVFAGASIGVLVPHLHRNPVESGRNFWIGMGPSPDPGGMMLQISYAPSR